MTELTPGEEHDGSLEAPPYQHRTDKESIHPNDWTRLVAFVSFWTQAIGLIGADGIMPAAQTLPHLEKVEARRYSKPYRSHQYLPMDRHE